MSAHVRECIAYTIVNQAQWKLTPVNTFASRLADARNKKGLSQIELARLVGVKPGSIGNYESGIRKSSRQIVAIAKALGVDPTWLETGKGPRHPPEAVESHNQEFHVAQPVSPYGSKVPPRMTWEELMKKTDLPTTFRVTLNDDALAPRLRSGDFVELTTNIEPGAGDGVLIQDAHGNRFVRIYRLRRPGVWSAAAPNEAYESMDGERDGLTVLAVVTGEGRSGRWNT